MSSLPEAAIRTQVRVPLRFPDGYATSAVVTTFHGLVDGREHLALGLGPMTAVPLVRPHSECLTGDVFGSQRCDCGPQLREAVQRIAETGGGGLYPPAGGRGGGGGGQQGADPCARRSSGSPRPAGTCSTCGRRAAGSGCTTSWTPTRCRTRAWTPTRRTSPSATPRTSATTPWPPRGSGLSASGRWRC